LTKPRFPGPPYDPVRSDFPNTVLTLAFPQRPSRPSGGSSAGSPTPRPESVYLQARPSRMAPPTHVVDHPETAKCPELLCLAQALLAPGWCHAPPRRALPLRPRSYELMRQTTFLRRIFVFHTYIQRSLQVAASPCWKGVLPDVALQVFPRMLGPRSRRVVGCTCLFLPPRRRPSPKPTNGSASRINPLRDFRAVGVSRSSPFLTFRPPGLFATQVSPTAAAPTPQGSRDFYARARHAPSPGRASGMLAVRTRQLTAEDFHLLDLQPCRPLLGLTPTEHVCLLDTHFAVQK